MHHAFLHRLLLVCASQRNQIKSNRIKVREQQTNTWRATACCNNTRRAQYTHKKYEVVVSCLHYVHRTLYRMCFSTRVMRACFETELNSSQLVQPIKTSFEYIHLCDLLAITVAWDCATSTWTPTTLWIKFFKCLATIGRTKCKKIFVECDDTTQQREKKIRIFI